MRIVNGNVRTHSQYALFMGYCRKLSSWTSPAEPPKLLYTSPDPDTLQKTVEILAQRLGMSNKDLTNLIHSLEGGDSSSIESCSSDESNHHHDSLEPSSNISESRPASTSQQQKPRSSNFEVQARAATLPIKSTDMVLTSARRPQMPTFPSASLPNEQPMVPQHTLLPCPSMSPALLSPPYQYSNSLSEDFFSTQPVLSDCSTKNLSVQHVMGQPTTKAPSPLSTHSSSPASSLQPLSEPSPDSWEDRAPSDSGILFSSMFSPLDNFSQPHPSAVSPPMSSWPAASEANQHPLQWPINIGNLSF